MRVLIDTTYAGRGHSGTGVYLERLIPALRALGVDVLEAANDGRRAPAAGGAGSWRNLASDRRWVGLELPARARASGAQVLHHPLPEHSPRAGVAQVVTVHDLAVERVPWAFDGRFRAFAHVVQRRAARAADAVVCPSQTSARDAAALWGIDPHATVVARHGPGQLRSGPPRDAAAAEHLLYVGDREPRKNLALLLAAYARYREHANRPRGLVLAGRLGGLDAPAGVTIEREPSPERLTALYAGAIALVHPALHEGVGLTVLEAMHAGVPVIAAAAPGVVETCGEAAHYVDPRDSAALAAALAAVAADPALGEELSVAGRRRVAAFGWEASARAHLEAYTLALRRSGRLL